MSEENSNPLEGFKNLAADIMPAENLEIKDVQEVPEENLTETLGADTGVKDLTDKKLDEGETVNMDKEKEEEKEDKESLTPNNLEIAYKDEIPEGEVTEEEIQEDATSDDTSQLSVIANFLKEEGIVDFDEEEFEDSEEGFQKNYSAIFVIREA